MSKTRRGFVDIQLNGYMGVSFSAPELTGDDVRKVTLGLLESGTVAYCPTVTTASRDVFRKCLPVLARAMSDPEIGGHLLGIHLEGPFISPKPGARGAHPEEFIIPPSIEDFDRFQEWAEGNIAILTLAPELPGAIELTEHAVKQGVIVALGHLYADADTLARAVDAGARCSTHLGNGIPLELNRNDNPIWWQLACDDLYASFITDGHHLPPIFIKTALRAKGVEKFIVTSDASAFSGLPAGDYDWEGDRIIIEPTGRISFGETGYLAGSHVTMLRAMNYLASLNLLTEDELWKVGYFNPLKLLGRGPSILDELRCPELSLKDGSFVLMERCD